MYKPIETPFVVLYEVPMWRRISLKIVNPKKIRINPRPAREIRWSPYAELIKVAGVAPTELQELGGVSQSQPTT